MHVLVLRAKSAAQRFELWRESDAEVRAALLNEPTLTDVRRNLFCVGDPAVDAAHAPVFRSSAVRWNDLAGAAGMQSAAFGAAPPAETEGGIYGVQPSLMLANRAQLHELRAQLSDLIHSGSSTIGQRTHQYESRLHCAFCGDLLLHSAFSELGAVHSIEVREDHFLSGAAPHEAITIHCQHVIEYFIRLHLKTQHIAAELALGDARWTIAPLMREPRVALGDAVRALKGGLELRMTVYALVRVRGGDSRYVTVHKTFHLCFLPATSAGGKREAQCWPARTTQLFDSVFLSRAHLHQCLEVEATTVDPLQSWRATKWANTLAERAKVAHHSGLALDACKAVLLRSLLQHDVRGGAHSGAASTAAGKGADATHSEALLASVGRMLRSTPARLHSLAHLNRTLQGVLQCTRTEENKLKCDQKMCAGHVRPVVPCVQPFERLHMPACASAAPPRMRRSPSRVANACVYTRVPAALRRCSTATTSQSWSSSRQTAAALSSPCGARCKRACTQCSRTCARQVR